MRELQNLPLTTTEADIVQLKEQYDMFRKLQELVLEKDVDYGFPAGNEGKKPSLFKSGAEKLTRLFNLTPSFEIIRSVETDTFIMYEFKCVLTSQSGSKIGEGFGACNSREKKGWSENPWAFQNNILKMAKKRAHVDAVLTGLGASNVFTQDLEDSEEEEKDDKKEKRATEKQVNAINVLVSNVAKLSEEAVEEIEREIILDKYGVKKINELSIQQASQVIDELKKMIEVLKTENN